MYSVTLSIIVYLNKMSRVFCLGLEDDLPRLKNAEGPMERLMQYMREDRDVLVVTRGMREVRAILTGKLGGFDRFWNLVDCLIL